MSKPHLPGKILLLSCVWPEPESSAAGRRSWNLVEALLGGGWQVTWGATSRRNAFTERLSERGIETAVLAVNDSSFDPWIATQAFDWVIFDRFVLEEQFGWRVRRSSSASRCAVDTQDLHFLRRARQRAIEAGESLEAVFEGRVPLETEDAFRELACMIRSDLTLVLSTFEHELLTTTFGVPKEKLLLLPLLYTSAERKRESRLGFEQRRHFVMIGNFRHPPNADGARWLRERLWPAIRARLPGREIHLYGAYPSREMMALDSPSLGFRVRGPADDALTTLERYRVNLAPLRFGAGVKGKICDGWAAGTPAVTTPIGAEGMARYADPDVGSFGGRIGRSEEEFVAHAVALYSQPLEWQAATDEGSAILEERFSFEPGATKLVSALSQNPAGPTSFRDRMLAFHSYRGSRFLSRWIELKNRGMDFAILRPDGAPGPSSGNPAIPGRD